jgi:hypothetical protein
VWEPNMIANPKCKVGCGEWHRPTKHNPDYKGPWSPPLIDNPAYKVRCLATSAAAMPGGCRTQCCSRARTGTCVAMTYSSVAWRG